MCLEMVRLSGDLSSMEVRVTEGGPYGQWREWEMLLC